MTAPDDGASERTVRSQHVLIAHGAGSAAAQAAADIERATQAADIELVRLLRREGVDSTLFHAFQDKLRDVATGTIVNLWNQGTLFRKLGLLGVRVPASRHYLNRDIRTITFFAVSEELPRFMDRCVLGDGWDPERSSLSTTFVSGCLLSFGREYRRFLREESDDRFPAAGLFSDDDFALGPEPASTGQAALPEAVAVERDLTRRLLHDLDDVSRHILLLVSWGTPRSQIAEHVGLSESAVDKRIRRARERFRQDRLVLSTCDMTDADGRAVFVKRGVNETALSAAWEAIRRWGMTDLDEVNAALGKLDECRRRLDEPRYPALCRPVTGVGANRLDFVLGTVSHDPPPAARKAWTENGARVSRMAVEMMQSAVPNLTRPGGATRDLQLDLRRLSDAMTVVAARTS